MKTSDSETIPILAHLSDQEISTLVTEQIPEWKQACENSETDTVLLTQAAFGHSAKEVLLLVAAIKYAGMKHKAVTIIPQD